MTRAGVLVIVVAALSFSTMPLAAQQDPERYNREVIFPDKVRLNREYVECYRFGEDLRLLALTFFTRREG